MDCNNNKHKWFLTKVVETCDSDTVLLSYLQKIGQNKEGEIWAYPEVLEVLKTNTYHTFILLESNAV